MTVVSPHLVALDVARLRGVAAQVGETYIALHESGWHRDFAGEIGRSTRAIAKDGSSNGAAPGLVAGRAKVRAKLTAAADGVSRALAAVDGALATLHEVAEVIDAGAEYSPEQEDRFRPRTVTKAEVAELGAMQAKRDAQASLVALRRARADASRERNRTRRPKGKAA